MKTILLLASFLVATILTGCAGPTVTSFSDKFITIRHDPSLYEFETVQKKADALCEEHFHKKAVHVLTDPESKLYIQHSTFECK